MTGHAAQERLLASLPRALGRTPADEIVLVGVRPGDPGAPAVLVTVPIEVRSAAHLNAAATLAGIEAGVRQVVDDAATALAAVVYVPEERWHRATVLTGFVRRVAARTPLTVLDLLSATPSLWRSELCRDPFCCPPYGNPLPQGVTAP